MGSHFGHVMGLPIEETGATLAPVAAVLFMALRATVASRLQHAHGQRRGGTKPRQPPRPRS